jgi:hypothetical protein
MRKFGTGADKAETKKTGTEKRYRYRKEQMTKELRAK